MFLFLL